MNTIHIAQINHGTHMLFGTDVVTIKAGGDATSGSMLVFELRVPAGGGPPTLHRHEYSEVFYLLEGEFEISRLDAENRLQTATLKAGDTVAIPSLAWHTFKNVGAATGILLAVHSPPVMEELLHAIGVPIDDPLDPPTPAKPPSTEEQRRFMSLIGQYMEMLLPDAIAR
jgi:mannose-6-phosphate isomerase-like protein (cupin superfamily)